MVAAPHFLPTPHVLTAAEVNHAMDVLAEAINSNTAAIAALAAPSYPDLSGYETHAEASLHNTSGLAHPTSAHLLGVPGNKEAMLLASNAVLAGTGDFVWDYPQVFAGIVAVLATTMDGGATPLPVKVVQFTNTQAIFRGTPNTGFCMVVFGWI